MEDLLQKIYSRHETFDPIKIAKYEDISIVEAPLDSTTYGLTCKSHRVCTIIINSALSVDLYQFVLAHELGHYFLHKGASTPFLRARNGGALISKKEKEADLFATLLLQKYFESLYGTPINNFNVLVDNFCVKEELMPYITGE